jgi:transketolase
MVVISPCDEKEVFEATKVILEYDGPVYMRSGRSPVPSINDENYKFKIGQATVLKEGKDDIIVFATGVMVHRALEAVKDSDITVINVSTIKPIDEETIIKYSKNKTKVITCEDHNIIGGLGSAIMETAAENCPVPIARIGLRDTFAGSGLPGELLDYYKMSVADIVQAAKDTIKRK